MASISRGISKDPPRIHSIEGDNCDCRCKLHAVKPNLRLYRIALHPQRDRHGARDEQPAAKLLAAGTFILPLSYCG